MKAENVLRILAALAVGIIGFDIYLAYDGVDGNTISELASGLRVLPVLLGILVSHLISKRSWATYRNRPQFLLKNRYYLLGAAVVGLVPLDVSPYLLLGFGLLLGYELWPQFKD